MAPNLLLALSFLLPTPQEEPIRWPPTTGPTLHYQARFTKERTPDTALQEAVRKARKARNLPTHRRPPRQKVEVAMEIGLTPTPTGPEGTYRYDLERQSLRLRWIGNKKKGEVETPPALGNHLVGRLWGEASVRGEKPLALVKAGMAGTVQGHFRRSRPAGTLPAALSRRLGDHLLPLLWTRPLPCWTGEVVALLALDRETPVAEKTLIRDGTDFIPLGNRSLRVEFRFDRVRRRCLLDELPSHGGDRGHPVPGPGAQPDLSLPLADPGEGPGGLRSEGTGLHRHRRGGDRHPGRPATGEADRPP